MGGTVLYERDGAVATLTLSRPEATRGCGAPRDAPFGGCGQERR